MGGRKVRAGRATSLELGNCASNESINDELETFDSTHRY